MVQNLIHFVTFQVTLDQIGGKHIRYPFIAELDFTVMPDENFFY